MALNYTPLPAADSNRTDTMLLLVATIGAALLAVLLFFLIQKKLASF
ncbi:hypothetical protein HY214_02575 [Candidatus Roizmanbacteria bacterium]|nr:hypothetical protein [Candidatus Roizmanbacteria bacterium]